MSLQLRTEKSMHYKLLKLCKTQQAMLTLAFWFLCRSAASLSLTFTRKQKELETTPLCIWCLFSVCHMQDVVLYLIEDKKDE